MAVAILLYCPLEHDVIQSKIALPSAKGLSVYVHYNYTCCSVVELVVPTFFSSAHCLLSGFTDKELHEIQC